MNANNKTNEITQRNNMNETERNLFIKMHYTLNCMIFYNKAGVVASTAVTEWIQLSAV